MANYSAQMMPYANNASIRTGLAGCDQIVTLNQTIEDLYNLYQNNVSNPFSQDFSNVFITSFNCISSSNKYFEHIITFTRLVSIDVQIAFASVYYDYIDTSQYAFNGFSLEPQQRFNLTSITLNDNARSDACSSAEIAQDPLCLQNSSIPICNNMFSNPWIFNCSENVTTSTISPWLTSNDDQLLSSTASSILTPWQIGLICGLCVLFLLIILPLLGYFLRRHFRSKRMTFSCENLFTDMQNRGAPHFQAFQRVSTIVQPKQSKSPIVSHTPHDNDANMNQKSSGPYNQGIFIDHAKVYDPAIPSNIPQNKTKPTYISNNHLNAMIPKVYQTNIIPRPVSGTSTSQLRSITDQLEEDTLDELDNISLDHTNSIGSKKSNILVSKPFVNMSSVDESLHDEDAWMSILAVANAELDVLNRLENEQNPIRTCL